MRLVGNRLEDRSQAATRGHSIYTEPGYSRPQAGEPTYHILKLPYAPLFTFFLSCQFIPCTPGFKPSPLIMFDGTDLFGVPGQRVFHGLSSFSPKKTQPCTTSWTIPSMLRPVPGGCSGPCYVPCPCGWVSRSQPQSHLLFLLLNITPQVTLET